ncbi:hypothetical protein [Saccharopolyspora phatthalungensis]|uniref:Uncharacterized protein YukE n=1 Tax=Saccharopolyspora phatthalungensis TaxID=664693 RepID=A0A840Q8I7_9PSEU|nr:hypothetical protein [Saccharopolyspora phatthalungensis]MBB5158842.1 uncharacterized protein YukE [Saccharopolyspora phatthalungensis]
MTGSDELTSLLNQGFNGLEKKAQESIDKFNAAVHHINDWQFVLGPVMLAINPTLDAIREGLDKLVKLIKTAVEHHLPVVSLIVQSFNWTDNVQAPVNGLTHTKNHLSYYWEGKASDAYNEKVTAQNDAIGALASKADQGSKWLMDIAKYNVEYMTELAKMATGFLGALVAASVEAATVVEIPFAINDLAGAIGTLVTQALDNLVGIAKRFMEALSKVRDLKSMMTDQKLPQGQWPQAVNG